MFACAHLVADAWPACRMQREPVNGHAAAAVDHRTWRADSWGSSASSWWSAGGPLLPASGEAARPWGRSTTDWVATAPTPASAQLTIEPTPKK